MLMITNQLQLKVILTNKLISYKETKAVELKNLQITITKSNLGQRLGVRI